MPKRRWNGRIAAAFLGCDATRRVPMTSRAIAIPALAAWIALCAPAPAQDAGQIAFNNACRTCHTTREGDNRLGPSLHSVIGRKAGSLPAYNNYSESMKKAELVWDKSNLDRFIANPDQVVAGNNMKPYGGIASAEERGKIIAFLESAGR